MAHAHSNSKNNDANCHVNVGGDGEGKSATFHDFLGDKVKGQESAPVASGGRPRPEFSPSSDRGSERPASNHLEGIPYYGSRGGFTESETSFIFRCNKRSNSDSFMAPSRDNIPAGLADSQDNPVLTKLMRYSTGERPKHPHEEETSFGVNQIRPIPASCTLQPPHSGRADADNSKWDRSVPASLGQMLQYPPPHTSLVVPLEYQTPSNRIKDTYMGSSIVSQMAADEGSRTGIKGSGVLNSANLSGGISGRQPSGVLIRTGKQKSGVCAAAEPETSIPSQHKTESTGRQMTIFYAGQAHVFDNIHPNKADVIMALAGSNGGSWSTVYTPNSAARPSTGENRISGGESNVSASVHKEMYGRPSDKRDLYHGFGSGSYPGIIRNKEKNGGSIKEANVGAGKEAD